MTNIDLKPCPCCGGEAMLGQGPVFHFVYCQSCKLSTDNSSRENVIAEWNRRVSPPAAVPDGWIMVPATPTREMIIAHDELQNARGIPAFANSRDIWRAMISAAPAAPNGWQPIETAPKDGTRVLLLTLEGHISVGAWKTPSNGPWVGVINNGPAYRVWDLGDVIEYRLADLNPTHWQPLPAAPTEAGDE